MTVIKCLAEPKPFDTSATAPSSGQWTQKQGAYNSSDQTEETMKASEEINDLICNAVPSITPVTLDSIFAAVSGNSQLLFVQGEGHQVVSGKSEYPDYLQVRISSAQDAAGLAQQLLQACAAALANGGEVASPITLSFCGQAIISE
ncbi:hypothetical protein [Pseudomonas syringae]|uniref:hypothetical protein n=1 Tax=Pseudomonas syringae TaxID=317 RepID=UPI001F23DFC3|nr:hypothetical protein [Pseudomonas syringae]MCF5374491.1 hypothetical protein [Pseudomonas syringae]